MQVFIIGTPLETAMALDAKRLNKQTIEARQILKAIVGDSKAWANHPCTLMYREHWEWLYSYERALEHHKLGNPTLAKAWSEDAERKTPPFHTEAYFKQMKRRLFTKNPEHYSQWAHLGTSNENWYFVDGEWRYYCNGKRIPESEIIPMF